MGALVHQDNPAANIQDLSPWLDLRVPPKEVKIAALEAQDHRRIIKTHLPVDALRMHPDVKYIYVARDGRDIAWSMFNHYSSGNDQWYAAVNDAPGAYRLRPERWLSRVMGCTRDRPNPAVS